jgi:hypothetical protein
LKGISPACRYLVPFLFEGKFSDLNKCSKLNQAFQLPFLFHAGNTGDKKEGVQILVIYLIPFKSHTLNRGKK